MRTPTMGWAHSARTHFLAAGQAAQFSFGFKTDVPKIFSWQGPQLAVARADPDAGDRSTVSVLVTQWQGTRVFVRSDGRVSFLYVLGINNASERDVWFHLEGGKLA
jgi:hypothetical protein